MKTSANVTTTKNDSNCQIRMLFD